MGIKIYGFDITFDYKLCFSYKTEERFLSMQNKRYINKWL